MTSSFLPTNPSTGYDSLSAAYDDHGKVKSRRSKPNLTQKRPWYFKTSVLLIGLNLIVAWLWTWQGAALGVGNDNILPILAAEKIILPPLNPIIIKDNNNNDINNNNINNNNNTDNSITALAIEPTPIPIPIEATACYVWELTTSDESRRAKARLDKAGWSGFSAEFSQVTTPDETHTVSAPLRYRFTGLTKDSQQALTDVVKTLGILRLCE